MDIDASLHKDNGYDEYCLKIDGRKIGVVNQSAIYVHWGNGASTARPLPDFTKDDDWLARKISLLFDKDNKLVGVSIRDLSISP